MTKLRNNQTSSFPRTREPSGASAPSPSKKQKRRPTSRPCFQRRDKYKLPLSLRRLPPASTVQIHQPQRNRKEDNRRPQHRPMNPNPATNQPHKYPAK